MWKQICVIPFRRDFLIEFNRIPEMPLEQIESVDMMRVLETGGIVRMVETREESVGVDTPADLQKVEQLMRNDPLLPSYL